MHTAKLISVILLFGILVSSCVVNTVRHVSECEFSSPYYLAFNEKGEQIVVPTKTCIEFDYYCGADSKLDEKYGCNIGDKNVDSR